MAISFLERISSDAIVSTTAPYTVLASNTIVVLTSAGTVTLPSAVGIAGKRFILYNSSAGDVIISTPGETISGRASGTLSLVQNDGISIVSNGANYAVGEYKLPVLIANSNLTQSITTANVAQQVLLPNTVAAQKVIISSSTITISQAGLYSIEAMCSADNTGGSPQTLNLFIKRNGVDVVGSNARIGLTGSSADSNVMYSKEIVCLAGDTIGVWMSASSTNCRLQAVAAGGGAPSTNSVSIILKLLNF